MDNPRNAQWSTAFANDPYQEVNRLTEVRAAFIESVSVVEIHGTPAISWEGVHVY